MIVFQDVTDRKCEEDAGQGRESRFHALAETSTSLIRHMDQQGNAVCLNPLFQVILGKPLKNMMGTGWPDPTAYGTHSMRRTKAALIYRRTKNLRAVQLLLGHMKLGSTVRYLRIEVDDALEIAEQNEVQVAKPAARRVKGIAGRRRANNFRYSP